MQKTIILILSFCLMSCGEDDPMPLKYVYVVDVPHEICAKKEIIDAENLVFKHVEDLPLIECDGNVSIAKDDFLPFKKWVRRTMDKVKECAARIQNAVETVFETE